ncbi:hypothetical protein TNCV_4834811 [Trichonephila clavipes]|nr:hypothetical protein TNCV_4834811 [Trichonephila clavipes]
MTGSYFTTPRAIKRLDTKAKTRTRMNAGCGVMSQYPNPYYHGKKLIFSTYSLLQSKCKGKFICTVGIAVIAFTAAVKLVSVVRKYVSFSVCVLGLSKGGHPKMSWRCTGR